MPQLTIYSIVRPPAGEPPHESDDVVDRENYVLEELGPVEFDDFEAKLYVTRSEPQVPDWVPWLQPSFPELVVEPSPSVGAVALVRLRTSTAPMFALTFGPSGRFLMRDGMTVHGYGLRTALNAMYPKGSGDDLARMKAVDAKRRGANIVRSHQQATRNATVEAFDLDRLRDLVSGASGKPAEIDTWGTRITGKDALHVNLPAVFEEAGKLCRLIERTYDLTDYQTHFKWLDFVQPVSDPALRSQLEEYVVTALLAEDVREFELGPPEMVDWKAIGRFRYHYDRAGKHPVTYPELRLADYLQGLKQRGDLETTTVANLRTRSVFALDANGEAVHRWNIWRCLAGEFELNSELFVLDEGEFFTVTRGFREELDAYISSVPAATVSLPKSKTKEHELQYNEMAARDHGLLLLDTVQLRSTRITTPVEICDLLSKNRQLLHVKRHLGSRDLSHLFAQGAVSAELLQEDKDYRAEVRQAVAARDAHGDYDFFHSDGIKTSEFEVVYVIIAKWRNRTLSEGLPFFSKVNLRRTVENLQRRNYRVAYVQVDTDV